MTPFEFVQYPVENKLKQIFEVAEESLFISTPFIKNYGVEVLLRSARQVKTCNVLTNLEVPNILSDGFDLDSLSKLFEKFDVTISSLGKLHAKAYIADHKIAFLTSANLTRGGLRENYEYGIIVKEKHSIDAILEDMKKYFGLGNIFGREAIESIQSDIRDIKELQQDIKRDIARGKSNLLLKQKEADLQTKFFKNRIKEKTVNAIFAETIKYLLESRGPLSTQELHPFIKDIDPDICDDTIDRIIDGQHFGKRWKHLVRGTQQFLKRGGQIDLKEGKWFLA